MDSLRYRLRLTLAVAAAVMVLGIIGFVWVEGLSPLDALYFSLVTVFTVGYGDIHPVSPLGKVMAMVLIVSGVGTFAALVANISETFLTRREKALRQEKVRTITGIFFSRMGGQLLAIFAAADPDAERLAQAAERPEVLAKLLAAHAFRVNAARVDRAELTRFLHQQSDFLLRLWENPSLVDETEITSLLRATFHLGEELYLRHRFTELPASDLAHLNKDMDRVYGLLARQWLVYLDDIKQRHPYLHHLAVRLNPYDPQSSVVVKE